MQWLNYHHLYYFWVVAREGSIARACQRLLLSQPTVSAQLAELERSLGAKLFERVGRGRILSETGRTVFRYAEEIFALGQELQETLRGQASGRPLKLEVGASDALPKLVVYRLLEPAWKLPQGVQLVCQDDKPERLLAALSVHELDLVLTDAPVGPAAKVRVYHHLLGECDVSLFATAALARRLKRGFPRSLDGAPWLLPTPQAALRRSLEMWFDQQGIRPRIVGEFSDSGLVKTFGGAGVGVFAMPSVVAAEVRRQYGVQVLARLNEIRERFYAISIERRLKHPAVVAISQSARSELFAAEAS